MLQPRWLASKMVNDNKTIMVIAISGPRPQNLSASDWLLFCPPTELSGDFTYTWTLSVRFTMTWDTTATDVQLWQFADSMHYRTLLGNTYVPPPLTLLEAILATILFWGVWTATAPITHNICYAQAWQWANPGFKFLSLAQTRPTSWRARPKPDPTQKNPGHPKQTKLFRAGIYPILFKDVTFELGCF